MPLEAAGFGLTFDLPRHRVYPQAAFGSPKIPIDLFDFEPVAIFMGC